MTQTVWFFGMPDMVLPTSGLRMGRYICIRVRRNVMVSYPAGSVYTGGTYHENNQATERKHSQVK